MFQKKHGSVSEKRLQCFSENTTMFFYNKYQQFHERKVRRVRQYRQFLEKKIHLKPTNFSSIPNTQYITTTITPLNAIKRQKKIVLSDGVNSCKFEVYCKIRKYNKSIPENYVFMFHKAIF